MFALTNAQFQVWDITNSASVLPWSSDGTTNSFLSLASLGGTGTNLDCGGNYFYTALASSQGNNKDVLSVIVPYVPSTYTLANSGDITVVQGSGGSNTITATLTGGLPTPVTFAASGLPAGASVNYSNNPCTVTCTNTLTISTTASTPAGTYPITVTGTNGVTTSFNLVVSPTFTYTLSASPGSITMSQGTTKQVTVTVTKTAGTAQSVTLSLSGLQNNTSLNPASLSCTPASGTCTATFNIIAASNAQKKTNTITVTGTSPTRTTTFTLTIQ
jgi:VCBS repeat-containing protein